VPDTSLFRAGLLEGRVVAVFDAGPLGEAASAACRELGARTPAFMPGGHEGPLDTLVIDAAGRFAAAPQVGLAPLRAAADDAWVAARAAGTAVMIDAPGGGKIILLAPAPDAGPHAEATRAALENMARTLSIEWARYDVRVTAIHPGAMSRAADVAALVAYLASPAGDYFSGCVFSLDSASG
jgi:NAD(P)-dependent dehydrogenase (short-subunit alcohol dehydrogenase family)